MMNKLAVFLDLGINTSCAQGRRERLLIVELG